MIIRGNRRAAAGIAVAGAGLSVFLAVIALLIAIPQLILGVGALVVAFAFAAVLMMQPVSFSLEGGQVVYRSGREEKRFPPGEVARCSLAQSRSSAGWVFSNQAGSRLFALNAWRFQDTDVFEFCAKAGIAWDGPSMRPADRLGRDVLSAKWAIGVGIAGGAVCLVFMGLSAWSQVTAKDDLARYRVAPSCNLFGSTSCRLETQARVVSVDAGNYNATLHLTLEPGGGDYRTRLALPSPKVGDVVAVEVWSGRVTLIADRETSDNPKDNPNLNINGVIAGFGLFVLACLGMAGWGWSQLVTARARLRAAGAN